MEANAERITAMLDQTVDEYCPPVASRASISSPNLMHFYTNARTQQQPPEPVSNESQTIRRQRQYILRLEMELQNEKKRLKMLQMELEAIVTPLPAHAIQTLTHVIQQLRNNCNHMTQKIDAVGTTYALGETDAHMYANADGHPMSIHRAHSLPLHRNRTPPPPIPAALRSNRNRNALSPLQQPQQQQHSTVSPELSSPTVPNDDETANRENANDDGEDEEAGWVCKMCTFRNNYLLAKCEQCEMPFLPTGNRSNSVVFLQMQQQQYL